MRLSIIIPAFHSGVLTDICVKSFCKFCPENIILDFLIVENSTDITYKDNLEKSINFPNTFQFINNPTRYIGSEANAQAVEIGLKYNKNDWIFMAHCDTCVTNPLFYDAFMLKIKEENMLIGTYEDINRIHAIHISGLMVNKKIAESVDYFPVYEKGNQILDVGDKLTKYCREHDIKHYCFENTFGHHPAVLEKGHKFYCVSAPKCVYNKNVIHMHLGRGVSKTMGTYNKTTGYPLKKWIEFINKEIL